MIAAADAAAAAATAVDDGVLALVVGLQNVVVAHTIATAAAQHIVAALAQHHMVQTDEIAALLAVAHRIAATVDRRRAQHRLARARLLAVAAAQPTQVRPGYVEATLLVVVAAVHIDAVVDDGAGATVTYTRA